MQKRHKVVIKILSVTAAIPLIVHAYATGPVPGVTGAPGDKTCIQAGCHSGTANSGPGGVSIVLPQGNAGTYTPGQTMQIMVQISDATKKSYGFELTARSGSNGQTQAGDFSTLDANSQVVCPDGSLKQNGKSCPAAFPIQDIEHSFAGWKNSISNKGSYTYMFNWTPPSTAAGSVTFYVAANCGTGTDNQLGTNVYVTKMVLTPAVSNPNAPSISPGGILPISSTATTIQPGSWISIYGSHLATSTAIWNGDFPRTLGGASVTINGKPGFLYFASPGQINLQAPDDTATGTVPVVVTTPDGTATSTVTLGTFGPSFSRFGDNAHVAGIIIRSDGSGSQGGGTYDFVGPAGTSLGIPTVPAKAGDTLVLFGVGFGPTTPAVPAGQPFSGAAPAANPVTLLINNQSITPAFAGITSAGLFQFNLAVPSGLGTGDVPLQAMVGGVSTPMGVVLSLQ
ncbi:MAG: hypothetical protein KGN84_20300 [Acidobacteriota bacterium]|nr:hypothetical protein [Acidobacteriota bacterium]